MLKSTGRLLNNLGNFDTVLTYPTPENAVTLVMLRKLFGDQFKTIVLTDQDQTWNAIHQNRNGKYLFLGVLSLNFTSTTQLLRAVENQSSTVVAILDTCTYGMWEWERRFQVVHRTSERYHQLSVKPKIVKTVNWTRWGQDVARQLATLITASSCEQPVSKEDAECIRLAMLSRDFPFDETCFNAVVEHYCGTPSDLAQSCIADVHRQKGILCSTEATNLGNEVWQFTIPNGVSFNLAARVIAEMHNPKAVIGIEGTGSNRNLSFCLLGNFSPSDFIMALSQKGIRHRANYYNGLLRSVDEVPYTSLAVATGILKNL